MGERGGEVEIAAGEMLSYFFTPSFLLKFREEREQKLLVS